MDEQSATTAGVTGLETEGDAVNEAPHHINSVDASSGQPIVSRVMARKTELEALLDGLPVDDISTQGDIYLALATINDLLTGDLENVPGLVVVDMNRWLEQNKHLAERSNAGDLRRAR